MSQHNHETTKRYCVAPHAIAALQRDGMGWGHELDSGCFHSTALPAKPGPLTRILRAMKRGA